MNIEESERERYIIEYDSGYYSTDYSVALASFIFNVTTSKDNILDLGCGHGTAVDIIRNYNKSCSGVDLTLHGRRKTCQSLSGFYEAPLWNMPFENNQFDYSYSSDVLEHIPTEKVPDVIREIYRVTKHETFHIISTEPDRDLHKTVKSIEWWESRFDRHGTKLLNNFLIDSKGFYTLAYFVNERCCK